MSQFEFQHIFFLFGWLLIPLFVLLYFMAVRWKIKALKRFGDMDVIASMINDRSKNRPVFKFILLMLAFAFLVAGIANLRSGSKVEKVKHKGVDIVIALDISNSMRAMDIKPSRLERAKMAISKLIEKFDGDQVGIVVFAGRAQTLVPVTPDYAAAKMMLSSAAPDMIPAQGTAIGAAIDLASVSFSSVSKNKKAIIIITDGENHEDDALASAEKAAKMGVLIHTIGMGSPGGAPIPLDLEGNQLQFLRDNQGNTVVTKLNEPMLQKIAVTGKGTYVRATSSEVGLNVIYDEINKMQKNEYEANVFSDYEDLFPYFMMAALFFIIAELLIFERKTTLTRNINLFDRKLK
jgi:Ca-activated chloride channel family protein